MPTTTYTVNDINAWFQAVQYRNGPDAQVSAMVAGLNSGLWTAQDVQRQIVTDSYTTQYVDPVINLYKAVLGRNPDHDGARNYIAGLAQKSLTFNQIAAEMLHSAEAAIWVGGVSDDALIPMLYQNILGRAPSAAETAYYQNALSSGLSSGGLINSFAQSPEFTSRIAQEVAQFHTQQIASATSGATSSPTTPTQPQANYTNADVNGWYQSVQFRDGPTSTVASYVALLNSHAMTAEQVQQGIKGDTYCAQFVNPVVRLYQAAFNRIPDSKGEGLWVGLAASGEPLQNIANGFANSDEFVASHGVNAAAPINAAILTGFYQNILGREPDSAGYAFWLNSGLTVGQVLNQFAQSNEFILKSSELVANFQTAQLQHTLPAYAVPLSYFTSTQQDSTAPVLSSSSPSDNATGVAVGANIVLTFSESVKAGAGSIQIINADTGMVVETIAAKGSHVQVSGGIVTINPTANLERGTSYYVTVGGTAFTDMAGNAYAGIAGSTALNFRTVNPAPSPASDTTAPMLSTSSPLDNAVTVAVGTDIVLTFSETVIAGSGNIVISDGSDTRTINVTDSAQVTIAGNTVTINPTFDLLPSATYNVQMASGVFTDAAGNPFGGISSPTTLDFTTLVIDTTAPTVSSVSVPSNGSYNVGDVLSFTVNSTENVDVTGTPQLALTIGSSTVYADYVSGTGTSALVFSYTVQPGDTDTDGIAVGALGLNSGALQDAAGNNMVLTLNSVGSTVAVLVDTTAPTLSTSSPLDNAVAVAVGADIVLTFSETVIAGSGNIVISDGSNTHTINVTDSAQVTVAGSTVTINPTSDLLPGSTYNVQMASGVFTDAAGNPFGGISSPTALDFTTLIPDTTAPTISAFSVASDSTLSVTSSESGTAQLYYGAQAIGSPTPLLAAATPYTVSVAQENAVRTAALKVFDDALNATTHSTDVILGTSAGDALTGTADADFIFGFDGTDILDGRLGADKLIGGSGVDQFKFITTSGGTSDSNSNGYDSIIDFTLTDYIRANLNAVTQFNASSSSYVVTNQWAGQNLLILSVRGNGSGSDADALVIGIGNYNSTSAASQVSYDIIGTSGADSLTGGDIGDYLTGGAGIDQLHGGNGTDALIIAATSDDAIGELYDGGNGADDYLYISGTTVVDLRDDTVTNIETLNMSGSSDAQSLTLLASQLSGFTLSVSADSSDSMTVYNMTGGAMSASGGTDTFVWGDADNGMNRITGFDRYNDKLRFDFVLNQGSNGAAVTTVDATNDLSTSSLLYTGFGVSSFAQAGKAAYALYLGIGTFDATASGILNTTNGIDFAIATEANILANVEAALENTSDGGGVGIVSRVNGSGVINGAAGTDIVFLLDDGGGDTAVIRYQEGGSAEADYAGELTLLGVIVGNTGSDFNPAWNGNIYALFA